MRAADHYGDAPRAGRVVNGGDVESITGEPVHFPPGRVVIRLNERHRLAYRRLYGLLFPLAGVPALKDHDFDGRPITLTRHQLAALNHALGSLDGRAGAGTGGAFDKQEQFLTSHFKEMQFLS